MYDINEISKDGIWFRDNHGRYILFRGTNFASRSKLPPYLPIYSLKKNVINKDELEEEISTVVNDLNHLKDLGYNIIRLLIMWKAIEPSPNPNLNELLTEGKHYLDMIKIIIDCLYERKLFVILDFHQDIAHEIYGGDGFPDWALALDEFHRRPQFELSNIQKKTWFLSYYINHFVKHTLRSFWKNNLRNIEFGLEDYPVRTHLEKTIGQTIKYLKIENSTTNGPVLIGIEPFNEPNQVGLGKRNFELNYLREFYTNVFNEIRKFDDKTFLFIEPRSDWNIYPALLPDIAVFDWKKLLDVTSLDMQLNLVNTQNEVISFLPTDNEFLKTFKDHGIFSFHYYDPQTIFNSLRNKPDDMNIKTSKWIQIFGKMKDAAIDRNLIPFLTEFGGNVDWENLDTNLEPKEVYKRKQIRAYIDLQFKQIEHYLLNSTYWNFDLYNTEDQKDNWNLENYSILGPNKTPRNFDIIARPYPLCSSAKPHFLFFDLKSKYAVIILEGRVEVAPTIIFIPSKYHYQNFRIWATSNDIQWKKSEQLLYWHPDKSKQFNQIIIGLDNDLKIDLLPDQSRSLLTQTRHTKSFN
jgi:Cellulase (glycosyl hydrolase family 5)